jgi:diphosphoinositol-polyphosphate diphosphatase
VSFAQIMGKSTTKDRSKQVRTFDADGYRRRADAIIFRDTSFTEVLLVSSRSEPERWTVAGGGIEPNETGADTSVREAKEEAGVMGTVDSFVGSFDDPERKTRTEVYILIADKMVDRWEDREQMDRRRQWFSLEEAIAQAARRPHKQLYLKAACKQAELRRQQSLQPIVDSHTHTPLSSSSPSSSSHFASPYNTSTLSLLLVLVMIVCAVMYITW